MTLNEKQTNKLNNFFNAKRSSQLYAIGKETAEQIKDKKLLEFLQTAPKSLRGTDVDRMVTKVSNRIKRRQLLLDQYEIYVRDNY